MALHRIVAVVIALLAVSTAAPAGPAKAKGKPAEKPEVAAARKLVQGCEAKPISDGVLFQCEKVVAVVAERGGTPAALLESLLGLVRGLGGELSLGEVAVTVGERPLPGQSFQIDRPKTGGERIVGRLFSFEPERGRARAVLCFSSKPSDTAEYQCTQLFSALGAVGPAPLSAGGALPPPAFLGRKVGVPEGCKAVASDASSFRIECAEGAALFYAKALDLKSAGRIAEAYRAEFLKSGAAAPDRDCVLSGVPVRCQVVDGEGITLYLATASVEKQAVIAICYQEPARVAVHPLCAQILSF